MPGVSLEFSTKLSNRIAWQNFVLAGIASAWVLAWDSGLGELFESKLKLTSNAAKRGLKYVGLFAAFVLSGQFSAIQFIKHHEHSW